MEPYICFALVLTSCGDGVARIWDVVSARVTKHFRGPLANWLHAPSVTAIADASNFFLTALCMNPGAPSSFTEVDFSLDMLSTKQ